jgi:hypothetical protein
MGLGRFATLRSGDAMSERRDDLGRRRGGRNARLAVLLACLAALVAYLVWPGSTSPRLAACVGGKGAPQVVQVAPGAQAALRESVARVAPQRVARLYEEGTVTAASAWTDEQPAPPPLSPTARRPAGYEMRWWAPNGDDVVADVLVFSSPRVAQRYIGLASSARCRTRARERPGAGPPQVANLTWLNPDGAAQADVYMRRGARVFRVVDAPAGQRSGAVPGDGLSRALLTIDTLACLLPEARCVAGSHGVPV